MEKHKGRPPDRPDSATTLYDLREEKGVTRQVVAQATGVPYATLTRLEKGTFNDVVNLGQLRALAEYYRQPLDVRHLLSLT